MTVWILLPAYNEENSIPLMFPKIDKALKGKGLDYRIVVIEDGSSDNTAQVLEKMRVDYPLDIIVHKFNRGLGETERDGFEYVAEHADDDDIITRLDCDDTHDPEYILALIDKISQGFDVVNTSRFQPGGGQRGVNLYRAFVSYCANIFMKLIFNVRGVRDYSCGFRAYRGKVIKDAIRIFGNFFIQLKGLGFTSTLETIVKLKLLGCRFNEIPFVLRYDKKASPSKMVSSVTTLGYLIMALLYHWPFGGWRRSYRDLARVYRESPEAAFQRFGCGNAKRSTVCHIGG
jgi:dolichol-phosphate mannosyltransferase